MSKVINLSELNELRERFSNKRVGYVHGVFDLFHHGHLLHLKEAKSFCDILVVSVTADKYVNKGPLRPLFSAEKRLDILTSIDLIDFGFISNHQTAVRAIQALKPDFYIKGPDYADKKKDITGGINIEEDAIREVGGTVKFTSAETSSSSELINVALNSFTNEQKRVLEAIKEKYDKNFIEDALNRLRDLTVCVIGEPIVDTYVECLPEGMSSKSPNVSARYLYSDDHAGGALAVVKHAVNLGAKVSAIIPRGKEVYSEEVFHKFEKAYSFTDMLPEQKLFTTPRKTRYISSQKNQKLFEITNIDEQSYERGDMEYIYNLAKEKLDNFDIVVGLDFGHGFWDQKLHSLIADKSKFFSLNVQTNSSNFGYNLLSVQHCYDLTVLDERELRLCVQDRKGDIEDVISQALEGNFIDAPFCVTLGSHGSIYVTADGDRYSCPAFTSRPLDTIGSGDAYFIVFSLLHASSVPPEVCSFVSNVFAAMQGGFVGNKGDIDVVSLTKAVRALLA